MTKEELDLLAEQFSRTTLDCIEDCESLVLNMVVYKSDFFILRHILQERIKNASPK